MHSRLAALLLTLLALAAAQPASAGTTAYAPGQGGINSVEIGIDVRASVTGRCGFAAQGAPSGTISQSEFDRTGFSQDFVIILNCSGASRVAVSSAKGGLATAGTAAGYASTAPYQVDLVLVADNGARASASCGAASLGAGGNCTFAGAAGSTNGLRLGGAATKANGSYLRVSAPAYAGTAPLVAGSYGDTLTITVSAAP